jgi:HPt (histidine-containing phosphotransfer) domain-containing protein
MQNGKKQNRTREFWSKLLQLIERFDLFLGNKLRSSSTRLELNAIDNREVQGRSMQQDVLDLELVDEDVLQQMVVDTSADVMPMLIDHYLEESKQRMERINSAVDMDDKAILEFEVHTLGSTALALGNRLLSNLARKIEHLCLDDKRQEAFELYPELKQLAERSFYALEQRKILGFEEPS